MAWTEESIVAEFELHIKYWQEKLRLRDITFRVTVADIISDRDNAWCSVTRDNCGDNSSGCFLHIRRGRFAHETRRDVWKTCAHELVHVMNWDMSYALYNMDSWYSTAQLNLANSLLLAGNERLAYKWEDILSNVFSDDAPPDEVP
jgi:hypothetical protein